MVVLSHSHSRTKSEEPLCCMRAPCPVRSKNEDRVLTHAVTHEQKKRGGNNGETHIYG